MRRSLWRYAGARRFAYNQQLSFHPAQRDLTGRHPQPVGVDLGIRRLATIADTQGTQILPEDPSLQAAMKGES
ncbi:MAG TPA: hypothetical protein VKG45_02180 [Actinomycetes bacterium]|nr:hypothetical protein [Actinomycetes bacterium]